MALAIALYELHLVLRYVNEGRYILLKNYLLNVKN
jgi:hypothetical protein